MNFVDLFFILVVAFMLFSGYRRGFVVSLISFVRILIGMPLSFIISSQYSPIIYNNYIKDGLINKISSSIQSSNSLDNIVNSVNENLYPKLNEFLSINQIETNNAFDFSQTLVDNFVEPFVMSIVKILLFSLTLLVFYVITWIIIRIFRTLFSSKKSFVRRIDKSLGLLFGFAKSVILVFSVSAIFYLVIQMCQGVDVSGAFNQFLSQLNSSYILELINKYNPILTII